MVAAIAFLADYLALRLGSGAKFDSIEVRRLYAVKLKGNKTNYMYDPPSPAACVNSVFPITAIRLAGTCGGTPRFR